MLGKLKWIMINLKYYIIVFNLANIKETQFHCN